MAETFELITANEITTYTNAEEAGAAFFAADPAQRPNIIHGIDINRARFMAHTEVHGTYADSGEKRFVKTFSDSHEVDKDFHVGYFGALEKSVNDRLKNANWDAVRLDSRLYDDLKHLSKYNFEKAASAWENNAPKEISGPPYVNRESQQQKENTRGKDNVIELRELWKDTRGPSYGVIQIDGKPATSVRYDRSEIDEKTAYNVSFYLGAKSVAKLKALDADSLADAVGDKNAKTIIEQEEGKGTLNGENLHYKNGLSPEEVANRQLLKESLKAVELEKMEPDALDEKNIVTHGHEKEQETAAGKVLEDSIRQREREQLALEQEKLGLRSEDKRIDVENLSEKAVEQSNVNDTAERTGETPDWYSQQLTEQEKSRQIELMEQVHNQFRVSGARFHFKDQPNKLAFKDKGERMVSPSNDERVAKAMATMAEAKGWKTITVSGHPDFKREVWMEASLRGLEVSGYKPTEQELKMLDARREHNLSNVVEKGPERKLNQQQKAGKERIAPENPIEKAGKAADRVYEGRVIEHGDAKYNHDPEEKQNYFVKLETPAGEKTVWGIDLKRAMSDSKAQTGDDVKLEYKGKETVKVEALQRDKEGKVIGSKPIETHRNAWEVEKSEKHKVVEAVASALIDSKVKDPAQRETLKAAMNARLVERAQAGKIPNVSMYDKEAPVQSNQERIGPQIEQNAERTR